MRVSPAFASWAVVLLLLGPSLSAQAREPGAAGADPWWSRDKVLHYGVSAGLAAAGYAGGALVFDSPRARLLTGAGVALGAGVGKELYDGWRATRDPSSRADFSWRDLTWDVLGTATGLGLSYAVDRLVLSRGAGASRPGAPGPQVSVGVSHRAPLAGPGSDRRDSVIVLLTGGW